MAASVELQGVTRRFSGSSRPALDDLTLTAGAGEVLVLVGPSGCGKSTTLRLVAGLDRPDRGTVRIADRDMLGVPPQSRDVAMVFQGFALYPHLRVKDILAFPLRMRGVRQAERERRVEQTAARLSLNHLLDRRPGELSGGEQQRVAMGRAIIRHPQVFLFDEPLSNLDAALRSTLRTELGKLLRDLEATALYVTHDQVEAMTLGDRIAVLRDGRLEQHDTPRRIYEAPLTAFVAGFFGSPGMNLLRARRDGRAAAVGALRLSLPDEVGGADVLLGIRPEHLRLPDGATPPGAPTLRGRVTGVEPQGAETHLEVACEDSALRVRVPGLPALALGELVTLELDPKRIRWFDPQTERAWC